MPVRGRPSDRWISNVGLEDYVETHYEFHYTAFSQLPGFRFAVIVFSHVVAPLWSITGNLKITRANTDATVGAYIEVPDVTNVAGQLGTLQFGFFHTDTGVVSFRTRFMVPGKLAAGDIWVDFIGDETWSGMGPGCYRLRLLGSVRPHPQNFESVFAIGEYGKHRTYRSAAMSAGDRITELLRELYPSLSQSLHEASSD
jgi:hypothetical protein